MKHTVMEQFLLFIIGCILFMTGAFYENYVILTLSSFAYGYFMGCENKKVREI